MNCRRLQRWSLLLLLAVASSWSALGQLCTGVLFKVALVIPGTGGQAGLRLVFTDAAGNVLTTSGLTGRYEYNGACYTQGFGGCGWGYWSSMGPTYNSVTLVVTGYAPAGAAKVRFQGFWVAYGGGCSLYGTPIDMPYTPGTTYQATYNTSDSLVSVTGVTPYNKGTWNHTVVNTTPFVQRYKLVIDYASAADTEEVFSLNPGESRAFNVQNEQTFIPYLYVENVLADGLGTAWVGGNAGLPAVTYSTVYSPYSPVSSGTTTAGNIWSSQTSETRLGTAPAPTTTTQTRNSVSALTGDALQRGIEANNDQRMAELRSLLVSQSQLQTRAATLQLDAFNQGLERLRATVAGTGLGLSNAVAGLGAGASGNLSAPLDEGVGTAGDYGTFGLTAKASAFTALVPTLAPIPESPDVNFPVSLAALHPDLPDWELDFANEHLAPWVSTIRGVLLFLVTLGMFFASLKILSKGANV